MSSCKESCLVLCCCSVFDWLTLGSTEKGSLLVNIYACSFQIVFAINATITVFY